MMICDFLTATGEFKQLRYEEKLTGILGCSEAKASARIAQREAPCCALA